MRSQRVRYGLCGVVFLLGAVQSGAQESSPEHAPSTLPLAEWVLEGEIEQIDWNLDIDGADLRMDQRFEVRFRARVSVGDLGTASTGHELSFVSGATTPDGQWLAIADPLRESLSATAPNEYRVEMEMYAALVPGEYVFWSALYDEATGRRSVSRREIEVDPIDDDPFPTAYDAMAPVEFAEVEESGSLPLRIYEGDLALPLLTSRAIDLEFITSLSAPE